MFEDSATKPTHLVVYTDGGAWQDLRVGGWGVHGYFFTLEPAKVGTGCKKALPGLDGYETGKTGKPEITISHYLDSYRSLPSEATNNVAEISAGLHALETALTSGVTHLRLLSDSKYFLQGLFEWMPGWSKAGWQRNGSPIPNAEIWKQIEAVYNQLKEKGVEVSFRWVKGHSGDFGNDIVDRLASLSMRAALNGRPVNETTVSDAKGYWKTERKHSRMLNQPAWYFGVRSDARHHTDDGRTIYYQGELRESEDFNGKMISDASFSVVYLTEPDPVLETIRAESLKLAKASFYGLAIGYLPVIFKPENYELVGQHGIKFLTYDLSKNRLLNFRKEVMVEERRPVRRAYYAVDRLQVLESILQSFLGWKDRSSYRFTPITDILYESIEGKRSSTTRLKTAITQATKYLDVDVEYQTPQKTDGFARVRLVLGIDIPDRNTMAALAEEIDQVVVVTWADSESAIRFATILQTKTDVGIWSGVYSNLTLLPTPHR